VTVEALMAAAGRRPRAYKAHANYRTVTRHQAGYLSDRALTARAIVSVI